MSGLDADIVHWIESTAGGTLVAQERAVARREAWLVSVERAPGDVFQGFFRVDRNPVAGSTVSLEREARICAALQSTGVPVPAVHGWDPERQFALFERIAGTAAIDKLENRKQQRAVMEDFIDAVARLHNLAPTDLGLDDVLGPSDLSPAQCALDDLDAQLASFAGFLKHYRDPLLTYATRWLRRFVPAAIDRVSLVQGDTGPVNFMFEGDRVTALVDWEWGHWGDPMEDLGNICVREFWNPSGGLDGLFHRYQQASGVSYTPQAAMYYRVQQNVRGMIPIHAVCQSPTVDESMAWYMAYRYIGDRATCEGIAQAMGIAIEKPELPSERPPEGLFPSALQLLDRDIRPALDTDFARSRAKDLDIVLRCQMRRQQYGEALEDIETREVAALLGQPATEYPASMGALCEAIEQGQVEDEPLVRYLARHAYRDEWLHAPVAELYPDRQWAPLDA